MQSKYVLGIHIDREPNVRCEKYYTPKDLGIHLRLKRYKVLGENCAFEKWVKSFNGYEIELPIRIPHYSPTTLIECIEGKRNCGRTVEVYRLRPLALKVGARRALLLVYGTAAWTNDPWDRYLKRYADFVVKYLREILFVF